MAAVPNRRTPTIAPGGEIKTRRGVNTEVAFATGPDEETGRVRARATRKVKVVV